MSTQTFGTNACLEGLIRLIGEMIDDMREQEPHCTECAEKLLSRYANELVGIKAALAALPGGGVDESPLMPTLAALKETNPVVRACFDMYRHAQSQGYPFSLHSMLALLIAEMDRRHDHIEKLALDTLNMRPGTFFIPTPNPHEADRNE